MSNTNLTALGLHTGRNNTLCVCGPCQHRLRVLAARTGTTVAALTEALNTPERETLPPRQRPVRPLTGQVASVATVTVNGHQHTGVEAILATLRGLTPG